MLISPEVGQRPDPDLKREQHTVVCGPSHGLSTVPRGERIGGETGVDKAEVGAVHDMVQIMEVAVHLRRGELALVDNVLGGQRADIEALGQGAVG